MWQKCPVCNGTGTSYGSKLTVNAICSICNGMKIISELTGRPPAVIAAVADISSLSKQIEGYEQELNNQK